MYEWVSLFFWNLLFKSFFFSVVEVHVIMEYVFVQLSIPELFVDLVNRFSYLEKKLGLTFRLIR
jgi:hypothetical protein